MYKTILDGSAKITVQDGKHRYEYAVDKSLPNPLEATIAAINACAGVFTLKACQQLGISAQGIEIETTPKKENHSSWNVFGINAFATFIKFPEEISSEHRKIIVESVEHCAVKELIKHGSEISFSLKHLT